MSKVNIDQTKRWYVVHIRAGFERQVIHNLKERIQLEGLDSQFGEIVMPSEDVIEMRNGRKRKVPRKFFPGYILIQMEMNEATWYVVHKAPYVLGFLGGRGDKPIPLSQREVDAIFERLHETEGKARPKVLFEPGQMVRIISEPFKGFTGVVEEVDYEKKNRLRVSVIVFQRATSVELEFSEVEAA
jgi:transcriptional antiterminator NusG